MVVQRQGVVGNRGCYQSVVRVAHHTESEGVETIGVVKDVGQVEGRVGGVFFDVDRSDGGYYEGVHTDTDNLEGIVLDLSVHGIARIRQATDAAEPESGEGGSEHGVLGDADRHEV